MNDRLYRSVDDRVLAGVCAGLADRLDLDPALVRIGYAILDIVTGIFPMLVLYVIMAVVIPEEPSWAGVRPVGPQPSGPQAAGPVPGWPTADGSVGQPVDPAAAPAAPIADPGTPGGASPVPPVTPAPGAVPGWIAPGAPVSWDPGSWRDQRAAARAARHSERAARRAARHDDPIPAIIGGLLLVALGAFFLLRNTFDIDWAVVWPIVVIALGAVVLVAAVRPRPR